MSITKAEFKELEFALEGVLLRITEARRSSNKARKELDYAEEEIESIQEEWVDKIGKDS